MRNGRHDVRMHRVRTQCRAWRRGLELDAIEMHVSRSRRLPACNGSGKLEPNQPAGREPGWLNHAGCDLSYTVLVLTELMLALHG